MTELVFHLAPLILLVGLLLRGRFVGEERILRRCHRAAPAPPRRVPARWPRLTQIAFAGLLERSPVSRRGPPAPLAARA
jgi:hypothetical protein